MQESSLLIGFEFPSKYVFNIFLSDKISVFLEEDFSSVCISE